MKSKTTTSRAIVGNRLLLVLFQSKTSLTNLAHSQEAQKKCIVRRSQKIVTSSNKTQIKSYLEDLSKQLFCKITAVGTKTVNRVLWFFSYINIKQTLCTKIYYPTIKSYFGVPIFKNRPLNPGKDGNLSIVIIIKDPYH